jgi:hypothetical protein
MAVLVPSYRDISTQYTIPLTLKICIRGHKSAVRQEDTKDESMPQTYL